MAPIGYTRYHYSTPTNQTPITRDPKTTGYPLDQYTVKATPPSLTLSKGVRTLVPLVPEAAADGISFNQFDASRIAADGTRITPGSMTEAMLVRIALRVMLDPGINPLVGLLDSTLRTLSGAGPFGYALNSPQAVHLELDVGTAAVPNVVWAQTSQLSILPATIAVVVPLFGGQPFRDNGARVYATASTNGLMLTDVRTLLRQSRA